MMPWEIDYMGLTFLNLKESLLTLRAMGDETKFTIDSVLNLSSYTIDWKKSKLPKEYFIEKYNTYSLLLKDPSKLNTTEEANGVYHDLICVHNKKIYEDNKIYGHLDLQKSCIGEEFDYYLHICPDLWFDKHVFTSVIKGAQLQKEREPQNEFIITPSIFQMWDKSWNEIVHPNYKNKHHDDWWKIDVCEIKFYNDLNNARKEGDGFNFQYRKVQKFVKWAGWFDLYSKTLYEHVIKAPEEWNGYGPWDLFSMFACTVFHNNHKFKISQIITDQTISRYSTGPLNTSNKAAHTGDWLQTPIKKLLHLKKGNSKEELRQRYMKDGKDIMDDVRKWVGEREKEILQNEELCQKLNIVKKQKIETPWKG